MVVELPCAIGAKIWEVTEGDSPVIFQRTVKGFKITGKMKVMPLVEYDIPLEIGVNGFWSREEAEKMVKEIRRSRKR